MKWTLDMDLQGTNEICFPFLSRICTFLKALILSLLASLNVPQSQIVYYYHEYVALKIVLIYFL